MGGEYINKHDWKTREYHVDFSKEFPFFKIPFIPDQTLHRDFGRKFCNPDGVDFIVISFPCQIDMRGFSLLKLKISGAIK